MVMPQHGRGVTKAWGSGSVWKLAPKRVKAPYAKLHALPRVAPEYGRARETRSESAGPTPQG
jgi:hypothetical protein